MAGKKLRYATPESAALAAELGAREKERAATTQAELRLFHAAWAKRMERPVPPVAPPSELHLHTDKCFDERSLRTMFLGGNLGWYEGRWCNAKNLFIPEKQTTNPTAVTR